MINRIVLVGRMTRDPEVRYAASGTTVANFGIAVDRPTRNQETGDKETDFFNVVAFRKTAEFVSQYLTKGRLIAVDGRLQSRSYIAQDGQKRTVFEIVADNVQGLDRPRESVEPGAPIEGADIPGAPASRNPAPVAPAGEEVDPFADE
jgi:single-strand DNA-binding protein